MNNGTQDTEDEPHAPVGDELAKDDVLLPYEVIHANLTEYDQTTLAGRFAYYEREALFEPDPDQRAALKHERDRTRVEINRRKMYRRSEAERVFEL